MKMLRALTVAAAIAAGFCYGGATHAHARDGFAMTHHQYWYDWPWNIGDYGSHSDEDYKNMPPSQAEIDKAVADQKACRSIVMYTDAGVVRSKPDGCRK